MTLVGTLALCPPYDTTATSHFNFQTAKTLNVIASEAKQSIEQQERIDCFVALLLAMTSKHDSAFPRREAPELCMNLPPNRGRGECRVHDAPAASRAKLSEAHERSHHRSTGITQHSRTQWF
jgi:hypothetical protein